MARLKEHEKDCIDRLGNPFTRVHRWLDAFIKKYPIEQFEERHRFFRHNKEGVEKIRKMWGDWAAEAARLHIARDDFGYIPKTFRLSKDEKV